MHCWQKIPSHCLLSFECSTHKVTADTFEILYFWVSGYYWYCSNSAGNLIFFCAANRLRASNFRWSPSTSSRRLMLSSWKARRLGRVEMFNMTMCQCDNVTMLNNGNVTMLNMAMWQCGNVTTWQCLTMLNTESNLIWAASTSSTVQTSLQKIHSFCQYCSNINQLSKVYIDIFYVD